MDERLMESVATDRASRPGTSCEACGMPARRRVPITKPGWRAPEFRDLCLECAHELAALVPPSMTVTRVPAEPTRATLVEEVMSDTAEPSKLCKESGCTKTDLVARGYCAAHYSQHKRNGDFDNAPLRPPRPRKTTTATPAAPAPKPRAGTPPRNGLSPIVTTKSEPIVRAPEPPRFIVPLGELVVECRELGDVVELHRALGGVR
jgi:hypothetical protein